MQRLPTASWEFAALAAVVFGALSITTASAIPESLQANPPRADSGHTPAPPPSSPPTAAVPVTNAPGTRNVVVAPANGLPSERTSTGLASRAEDAWLSGSHADYAPSGMPDFSQCRGPWSAAGSPPQWTHAGPVAMANVLWWLDSTAEPNPVAPPTVNDGHALVTAYPYFGPARDDHVAVNLTLLVEDLATRASTNGGGMSEAHRGTNWQDLVSAAQDYVADRALQGDYNVTSAEQPSMTWIVDVIRGGAGTVLLLGVWERQGDAWHRVGGHYAALAGAEDSGWVALSDPLLDASAYGGEGRTMPDDAAAHSCREAPRAHDDARVVAHDQYPVYDVPGLPYAPLVLAGYFTPASFGDAAAYRDQNHAAFLDGHRGTWAKGSVVMAIDAGLAVVPRVPPLPSASATSDTTPGMTPDTTPSAPPPTTPTTGGSATPARTAAPSATRSVTPVPSRTGQPSASVPTPTTASAGTYTSTPAPTSRRSYLPFTLR